MKVIRVVWVMVLAGCLSACGAAASSESADAANGLADGPAAARPVTMITIPAGARLRVALSDGVSTTKSAPGDQFNAHLVEPVVIEGKTVLEKGTKVSGRVVDAQESGRVKGRASLKLILTGVVRSGDTITIETKPFVAVAEATKGRDAAIIGGGAGVGAAIGAIAGGGKGAGLGALVGGGAGTGTVLATKGKDLHYPPETRLNFTLSAPVQITL